MTVTNRVLLLALLIIPAFMSSCARQPSSAQRQKAALESELAKHPGDVKLLEKLMFVELVGLNENQKVVDQFEKHKAVLKDSELAGIYHATATCRLAGEAKSPVDKLRLVRQGMTEFEALQNRYPGSGLVYLWQAITYSNFPSILGADSIVVSDIALINKKRKSGTWTFVPAEVRLISESLLNLARIYKSPKYLKEAEAQIAADGLANDAGLKSSLARARSAAE